MDASRFRESTAFLSSVYFKRLGHLRGKISMFAYEKIKVEITFAWEYDEKDTCDCIVRYVYRIPCRHLLPKEAVKVPIDIIDKRWVICERTLASMTADLDRK